LREIRENRDDFGVQPAIRIGRFCRKLFFVAVVMSVVDVDVMAPEGVTGRLRCELFKWL